MSAAARSLQEVKNVWGKLLQELQREMTSQTSFWSSTTTWAGLQLGRIEKTAMPFSSMRRQGGGGEAILVAARETAIQGKAEAAA